MPPVLPLGLRNRLAELILDAFESDEARATLGALAGWCRDEAVGPETAARLVGLGWFEGERAERPRLRGAHSVHREALCRRAAAAVAMLGGRQAGGRDAGVHGLLARAAWLADAGLYFEVHEWLEPAWMRAEGGERLALQGLIQVAVALHHAEQGNREGAVSLLTEGPAKVETSGSALPLATSAWTERLTGLLAAWRTGAPAPPAPPWPRPTEDAWRCS